MQGIGGPDEDRSGGFERGGWTTPYWDKEAATFLNEIYGRADAFLFGPRTYEIFAGYWGAVADPGINTIATALNTRPKYVASTTHSPTRGGRTRPSFPVTSRPRSATSGREPQGGFPARQRLLPVDPPAPEARVAQRVQDPHEARRHEGPLPEVGGVDEAAALAREHEPLILVETTNP